MQTRGVSTALIGAGIVLCVFGLYESVDAALGVFRTPQGPLSELFDYPLWSQTHFVPGILFMALAPLQLWPTFRNRHRTLHRWFGRVVVVSGLFLAFSGAALVLLMPERPVSERIFMLTFFAGFLFFLLKAFTAALRRDFVTHRAWMIRMFCTGLTITTQRLLLIVFIVAFGVNSTDQFWTFFVSAGWIGWIIQLAVAEWWIARGAKKPVPVAVREAARV